MNSKIKYLLMGLAVLVAIAVPVGAAVKYNTTPGKYDELAQCLKEKGAVFYGAFWCPHCQNQKNAFGKSFKHVPYQECSTPDGKGQLQVCTDAGIESYPTWIFADGSKVVGQQSFTTLAQKTSCQLPADFTEPTE